MTLVYVVENSARLQSLMGEYGDVVKVRPAIKAGKESNKYILLEVKANSERYQALYSLLDSIPEVENAYLCRDLDYDNDGGLEEEWPRTTLGSFSGGAGSDGAASVRSTGELQEMLDLWPRVTLGSLPVAEDAWEPASDEGLEWPRITLGTVVDLSKPEFSGTAMQPGDRQPAAILEIWPRITQASLV